MFACRETEWITCNKLPCNYGGDSPARNGTFRSHFPQFNSIFLVVAEDLQ